jgi:hypothetical protein
MNSLRATVAEQMVRIHRITPELAEYHVCKMEPKEVKRRFLYYVESGLAKRAGMELSVADAISESGQRRFYPVSATRDDDGTLAALNPSPETYQTAKVRPSRLTQGRVGAPAGASACPGGAPRLRTCQIRR